MFEWIANKIQSAWESTKTFFINAWDFFEPSKRVEKYRRNPNNSGDPYEDEQKKFSKDLQMPSKELKKPFDKYNDSLLRDNILQNMNSSNLIAYIEKYNEYSGLQFFSIENQKEFEAIKDSDDKQTKKQNY